MGPKTIAVVDACRTALRETSALLERLPTRRGKRLRRTSGGSDVNFYETICAVYLMSGCNFAATLAAAQRLTALHPHRFDFPLQECVEEIAVSVPLDKSISPRARKQAAELLAVQDIEKLNDRGVAPLVADVHEICRHLGHNSSAASQRGREAWVRRFRLRWRLPHKTLQPASPDMTADDAKKKARGAQNCPQKWGHWATPERDPQS